MGLQFAGNPYFIYFSAVKLRNAQFVVGKL